MDNIVLFSRNIFYYPDQPIPKVDQIAVNFTKGVVTNGRHERPLSSVVHLLLIDPRPFTSAKGEKIVPYTPIYGDPNGHVHQAILAAKANQHP